MVGAALVDAFVARFLLLEHLRAAGAAAHAAVARLLRLEDGQAGDRLEHRARCVVLVVVPAQVARVVIRHPLVDRLGRGQLARLDEFREELRVMDDIVVTPEVGILIRERVEAMRTRRHDLLLVGAVFAQRLDVLLCERLEQVFVARPPCRIARAGLLVSQDRELHAGLFHQLDRRTCHPLGTLVERGHTSGPKNHVGVGHLGECGDVEPFGPVRPIVGRIAPGVSRRLEPPERSLKLTGEFAALLNEIAPHIDDLIDVADEHGAFLLARSARRTGPQHFRIDHTIDEILAVFRRVAVVAGL